MPSIINIECLKTIVGDENVLNIYIIIIFYQMHIRMHMMNYFFFNCYHYFENKGDQFRSRANVTVSPLREAKALTRSLRKGLK